MRKLTKEEKANREAHFAEFQDCWMCNFYDKKQTSKTELHHIAGRGKYHEVRENYCALCRECHTAIQSRLDAELVCLVLKREFDRKHYSPFTICELRHRSQSCWTDTDVTMCFNTMLIMGYVARLFCVT